MKSKGRFLELDAIRGIAAIIVVVKNLLDFSPKMIENMFLKIYLLNQG